jgi:hypothetical protein
MIRTRRPSSWAAAAFAAAAALPAFGQGFAIESAVLDTRSARNLGVTAERGELADLFRAQKALTFGILRAAGIAVESLPPEVRARVERFQTTSVEAFRAFSQGLDLKDQGRFAEAKESFRRAAEIDPGFALAVEQQQAMPEVNVGSGVQLRAVIAAASSTAVDRGRQGFVVDLSRAVAALQSGQTVSVSTQPAPMETAQAANAAGEFTSNPPGSGGQFLPNIVVGVGYEYQSSIGPFALAAASEFTGDRYTLSGANTVLDAAGAEGQFHVQRLGATNVPDGSVALADGSRAYWGRWLSQPGASASVTAPDPANPGRTVPVAPLGDVAYVFGQATTAMPTVGTAVFTPAGGSLANVSGSIAVNFVTRDVGLQNLGFSIGPLAFSGLNGSASYAASGSGAFTGNYSSGACSGCAAFAATAGGFSGNFLGRDAAGLVFSTILFTGNGGGAGTASGVQVFKR